MADLKAYLLDIGKTGNQPVPQKLHEWLERFAVQDSGSWESNYFRLLTILLTIEKAAIEPSNESIDAFTAPEAEDLDAVRVDIVPLIQECVVYKDWTLIEEILRIIKSQKKIIHPMSLPLLLDETQSRSSLHQLMVDTFGKRSMWLAGMQKKWQWWVEIQQNNPDKVNPENQLAWILLHYHTNYKPDQKSWKQLGDKDRKALLKYMVDHPNNKNEDIFRLCLSSRSNQEKYLAGKGLLRLQQNEWSDLGKQLQIFFEKNIKISKGKLAVNVDEKTAENFFHHDFIKIFRKEKKDRNPFFELLKFYPPDFIFEHLAIRQEEIIDLLFLKCKNLPFLQSVIKSAANFSRNSNWSDTILAHWIKYFPSENTTEIDLVPILESLSYENTQNCIENLLKEKNEYFLEKLAIVVSGLEHYIKKDFSSRIIIRLFQLISQRLSRTDTNHLLFILPHLQYLVDPRIYPTLTTHWQDIDYHQQKLGDALWDFRSIIKLRQQIMNTIIN